MSIKKYQIKKGNHSASGLNFGIRFKDNLSFRACFTESCLYNLEGNDKYDINKLFGFSTMYFHHKQSARVGWRCIDGENIELYTYSYNDSKRYPDDSNLLGMVKPNQWFICEIIDLESIYKYSFQKENSNLDKKRIFTNNDIKQKDWFLFHYFLFPYFGGNQPAPHDMEIYIEKL